MIVYVTAAALSMLIAQWLRSSGIAFKLKGKNNYVFPGLLVIFPLLFITIFRKNTGTDYATYTVLYYINNINLNGKRGIELLSILVFKCAQLLQYPRFSIVFFGITFCVGAGRYIYKTAKKYDLSISLCVLFFFLSGTFNWSISAMRQMTAVIICINAIDYILSKEPRKYLFVVLAAVLIHKTAFIFAVLVFVPYGIINKKHKTLIFVALFLPIISPVVRELIIFACEKLHFYENYFGHAAYDQQTYSYSLILLTLGSIVLPIATYSKWKNEEYASILFAWMYLALVVSLLSNIIPNSARIVYMFLPVTSVSMPYFLNKLNINNRVIMVVFYALLYFLFYIEFLFLDNQCGTFPYTWVF